jgi:hypothetical protein
MGVMTSSFQKVSKLSFLCQARPVQAKPGKNIKRDIYENIYSPCKLTSQLADHIRALVIALDHSIMHIIPWILA